ncbi:MAG: xanthine dehydrogenase family protein molybdopterin-binding subunit, partial [Candidatus Dormibacteraeota bacterium]|nr:xanthine dehydrogenase family protein molybdopterin-binding subunit [Candidatus Dormibacteraeota bacterium]
VITRSGHVDLGQGNQTALAQIVAEELDVPFEKVSMVMGNTNVTPDQGITAGSTTIRVAGAQLRLIAAEGRATLLQMASDKLGAPVSELKVKNGVVSHGSKKVSYGALVKGQALTATTPIQIVGSGFTKSIKVGATPKKPSDYTVVGKSVPRVDIPLKVSGHNTFVQDVKVPGMLHARMVHPPAIGAQVASIGGFTTSIPGAQVVHKGNLVAVVAPKEWDAIKGAQALQVTWTSWNGLPDSTAVYDNLRAMQGKVNVVTNRGNVPSALGSAAQTLTATYTTPFENHGMLGPSCAVADVRSDGRAIIYSQTQYPQGLQMTIASVLGISPQQVEILWFDGAGCYGREGNDDAGPEAAILSQMLGKPVRVQWMRADEHIYEPHGPGTVHDMKAGLDATGKLVAWQHEAWMPPNNDDRPLGPMLAGIPVGGPVPIGSWTGPDLYTFPNSYELAHELFEVGAATSPYGFGLRTTFLRSPGQYQITYAQEAFVDEIAAKARMDPLQFRLQNLTDPRAIAVLKGAAQTAGWESRPSPKSGAGTSHGTVSGQGIALVLRDGTYAASVVTLTVEPSSGKVQLQNVTVAQDSGLIINPSAIKHQIESSVLQTASRALHEEVKFNTSNVTSTNWSTYPILTMAEAPQKINYVLINHPEIPATGVGEPAVNTMPSAISSAIFDATGVRIRSLPMTAAAVKAAMASGQ